MAVNVWQWAHKLNSNNHSDQGKKKVSTPIQSFQRKTALLIVWYGGCPMFPPPGQTERIGGVVVAQSGLDPEPHKIVNKERSFSIADLAHGNVPSIRAELRLWPRNPLGRSRLWMKPAPFPEHPSRLLLMTLGDHIRDKSEPHAANLTVP